MFHVLRITFQRFVRWFASTRIGARIFSPLLNRLDLRLHRLSAGRRSLPQLMAGLDSLTLTTTGARSGREHTVSLLYLSDGPELVVLASNWGRPRHPDWYYNLRANPEVVVSLEGRSRTYVAREAKGAKRAEYWRQAVAMYPGYANYEKWREDREIKILILAPLKPPSERPVA